MMMMMIENLHCVAFFPTPSICVCFFSVFSFVIFYMYRFYLCSMTIFEIHSICITCPIKSNNNNNNNNGTTTTTTMYLVWSCDIYQFKEKKNRFFPILKKNENFPTKTTTTKINRKQQSITILK